jgi:transcriptional regulator with XRE-family HTH domain
MQTMERDPAYIAKQVKFIRHHLGMTQDNLAVASGLSLRTIEKVDSGRHRPDEQTLRSIARAAGVNVAYFNKPGPAQEARLEAQLESALRKAVVTPVSAIHTAKDFLDAFKEPQGFKFDMSAVKESEGLDDATEMCDWISDVMNGWSDVSLTDRLMMARQFAEMCGEIEKRGYVCIMGQFCQRLRSKDRPDLIATIGLMSIISAKDAETMRFAMVVLEGGWETLQEGHWQPK